MVRYNYFGQYSFFTVVIMMQVSLFGMYNNNVVFVPVPDTPEYRKLTDKFGKRELSDAFYSYHNNVYIHNHNSDFQKWSAVANSIMGGDYTETAKERRYFLIDIMLHTLNNKNGLDILHNVFSHKTNGYIEPWQTPQGPIHRALSAVEYDAAMNVSEDIRNTIFTGKKNYNAFIVIPKSKSLSANIKWSLYKGLGVVAYLVSRCLEKDDRYKKKNETQKNENPFPAFFSFADILQAMEEVLQEDFYQKYPRLETHEVKSLTEDRTLWLYKGNNWIVCGSASVMALLMFCLLRDKLPTMHQVVSFVVIF